MVEPTVTSRIHSAGSFKEHRLTITPTYKKGRTLSEKAPDYIRKDRTDIRKYSVESVLTKTDRILGHQKSLRVKFDQADVAPGWTDGEDIYISAELEPIRGALRRGFTPETMFLATGVNYHELAHTIFTPRLNSSFANRVFTNNYGMAFNILEDQSAETRFVKRYEPAARYFTGIVAQYMLMEQHIDRNYLLVSGRLFLPSNLRGLLRESFHDQKMLDDIDHTVREYKTCRWPADESRMYQLIVAFDRFLTQEHAYDLELVIVHRDIKGGSLDTRSTKEADEMKEYIDDSEEMDGQGEEDTDPLPGAKSHRGEDEDQEPQPRRTGGEEAPGSAGEEEQEPQHRPTTDEVTDAVEEAKYDALDDVRHEVEDRIESIRLEGQHYRITKSVLNPEWKPINNENTILNRCIDEFNAVKVQHNPGWIQNERQGKLNPRHYARALRGDDYVYRRWQQGVHDALDFEVVFLFDVSGSMASRMDVSSRTLWILQRMFDELDGITTIIGFSDMTYTLSQRGSKAERHRIPIYPSVMGTVGQVAFEEARRILSVSQKTLKLCVCVTDGGFSDRSKVGQVVNQITDNIAFVGIDMDVSEWLKRPSVIHTQTISDPAQLVDVVKGLALRLSDEHIKKGQQ